MQGLWFALVIMRVTAGVNDWMKVEGVMGGRRILRRLYRSCV